MQNNNKKKFNKIRQKTQSRKIVTEIFVQEIKVTQQPLQRSFDFSANGCHQIQFPTSARREKLRNRSMGSLVELTIQYTGIFTQYWSLFMTYSCFSFIVEGLSKLDVTAK